MFSDPHNYISPLQWTTVKRKVKDLLPADFNPRKITDEKRRKLERSLEKFNLVEIPVINLDNTLLAGHQRVTGLGYLGRSDEEIDVRIPNRQLTEVEAKEYMVISNTHAGEFDFDLLDLHFSMLDFEEIGFDLPDMSHYDLAAGYMDAEDDDYEIPAEIKTDIEPGDFFEIGQHRLLCGDATDPESWKRLCERLHDVQYQFDLIITDPPYNVDYTGGTKDKLKIINDKMSASQFYSFLHDFHAAMDPVVKPGAGMYVFHADTEGHNFREAFINTGNKLAGVLVWIKNSIVMGRSDYQWQHEPVLYGWKKGASHSWYSDRKQSTILQFDKPQRNAEHPTMKPIPLLAYLMHNSSRTGELVGDGFGGSGSPMVTSHKLKRRCFCLELDPRFCQVIVERMLRLDPDLTVLRNGQEWYPEGLERIKRDPSWVAEQHHSPVDDAHRS